MVSGRYVFCNNYSSQPLQLVPSLLLTGEKEYTRPTMVSLFVSHWTILFAKYSPMT